ncbi:MAG TPA: glycerophosphodiester phosphodiesterase family protein [Arenibacter sp.]|nr:glycerophosphodiester phosphodiesterase family protein [Arenibacter sp.]
MKTKHLIPLGLILFLNISCNSAKLANKVVAHRGAWTENAIPENSLASLSNAIELGCGGSELDIWMTMDNVLVVCHDPEFQGIGIETSTYEELSSEKLINGETLPKLETYIKSAQNQKKTKLILEIKTSQIGEERNMLLATHVVQMVHALKAQKDVEYICFDWNIGRKVISLDAGAIVAYLAWKETKSLQEIKNAGFSGIDYHLRMYKDDPGLVGRAKNLGLTTNVWTVNKEEDMKWLLGAGVDYITTDKPEILFNLLAQD